MQLEKIPFSAISILSQTDVAYQTADPKLQPFYKYGVNESAFQGVMHDKSNDEIDRKLLFEVLSAQYDRLGLSIPEKANSILKDSTFTITTAHQPALFSGPLYFIIKIASTIHLATRLSAALDTTILPVFIMGGEDHDFEEINHLNLFGRTITWKTNQTGSVGRMTLDGINDTVTELFEILGQSENAEDLKEKILSAVSGSTTYGEMMIKFVYSIFQNTDLIILNMDQPRLKNAFKGIMHEELFEQVSNQIVLNTQAELERAGFTPQAFVRKINLFYLHNQQRSRIEYDGEHYSIVDSHLKFTMDEIEQELEMHPERFSPNVVMRPLYQEKILPNLAYIGGGGEIAYWLERKSQFEHFGINFPMLIRRNSVLWINKGNLKQMKQFDLNIPDLFTDIEDLIKKWVDANTQVDLQIHEERQMIENAYSELERKSSQIDPTLSKAVAAEKVKQLKQFEQLGGRLMRAQKQKFDQSIQKIRKIKDKLFPNGGLQERNDNFISFYLQDGPKFIETLIEHLNPLEKEFFVFEDQE